MEWLQFVLIGCIILLAVLVLVPKKTVSFGTALSLLLILNMVAFYNKAEIDKDSWHKSLAQEVNLQQVTVQGESAFKAQVLIIYRDGKLEKIELMPNTTMPR